MFAIYRRYKFECSGKEFDMYVSKNDLTCDGEIHPNHIKKYKNHEDAQKELDYLNKIGRYGWTIISI